MRFPPMLVAFWAAITTRHTIGRPFTKRARLGHDQRSKRKRRVSASTASFDAISPALRGPFRSRPAIRMRFRRTMSHISLRSPVGDCACYTSAWDRYSGVQLRSFTRPQMSLDKIAVRSSASGLSMSVRNLLARSLPCSVSNLRCDGSRLSLDS